jgi:hypothetical protein
MKTVLDIAVDIKKFLDMDRIFYHISGFWSRSGSTENRSESRPDYQADERLSSQATAF